MKRKKLLLGAVLLSSFAIAKDYVLVVSPKGQMPKGNTEVFVTEGSNTDTLTIVPGIDATDIVVSLADLDGNVIEQQCLPADTNCSTDIIVPNQQNGHLLTVEDNNSMVYRKCEE